MQYYFRNQFVSYRFHKLKIFDEKREEEEKKLVGSLKGYGKIFVSRNKNYANEKKLFRFFLIKWLWRLNPNYLTFWNWKRTLFEKENKFERWKKKRRRKYELREELDHGDYFDIIVIEFNSKWIRVSVFFFSCFFLENVIWIFCHRASTPKVHWIGENAFIRFWERQKIMQHISVCFVPKNSNRFSS